MDYMNRAKIVYFTPPAVASFLESPKIKEHIYKQLGTQDVTFYDIKMDTFRMLAELGEGTKDVNSFLNGISIAQFEDYKENEGIMINPMIFGFSDDPATWVGMIVERDDIESEIFRMIDIPYDLYCETVEEGNAVDKESYENGADSMREIIEAMNETTEVLH